MKSWRVGGLLSVLVAVLLLSYYLGQPLYWDMQSRLQQAVPQLDELTPASTHSDSKQSLSTAGELSKADDQPEDKEKAEKSPSNESSDTSRPLREELKREIWEVPPPGSVMPPLKEFILRKEIVEIRAEKNIIAVTFANFAFMEFVLTWVKSLTDEGVTNLLVGAMDTQLLEALYWAGIPTFDMGSNMQTIDVGWGTPTFHKMGREKVILVNAFLAMEYEVLMCDTDMVWLRNPLPFFAQYPEADVLTSSDEVVNSVDDEKLEIWSRSYGAYNIGINFWRPTKAAKKFAAEWKVQLLTDDLIWDQNGFNDLMRRTMGPDVANSTGLFYTYDGNLKLGILPVSLFCSGHTYFVQALYKDLGLLPYAVHTTYQFAGTEGKRHRLRESKMFFDPPEYYNVPGGFLSYIPSLPEDLMTGGTHSVETHFRLVNHQLIQVRYALAIASTLNRTLVMPELWCRFDRLWFGHPGILHGTHTKQPFLCPMDHIFEVHLWLREMDVDVFGPMIRFREYSFLDNPRLPDKVKASTLKVNLCEGEYPECSQTPSNNISVPGVLQLPKNSTDDQLRAALSPYKEAEVIEFSSMLEAFGGFYDQTREGHKREGRLMRSLLTKEGQFMQRVKTYTGIWCCVQDHIPGHIWYDIYWDQKPGWKPEPPATPADDHPPF